MTKVARDPFEGFACKLGDVVIRSGGDEAWLAGAMVLAEDAPVAAVFIAPEAGADRAVYARAKDAALVWMAAADDAVSSGAEPPSVVEIGTVRFERQRRLPLRVQRLGSGTPDVGERAIVAEYTAAGGERLVMLIGSGGRRAWRGFALEPGMYDVLPGGATDVAAGVEDRDVRKSK